MIDNVGVVVFGVEGAIIGLTVRSALVDVHGFCSYMRAEECEVEAWCSTTVRCFVGDSGELAAFPSWVEISGGGAR